MSTRSARIFTTIAGTLFLMLLVALAAGCGEEGGKTDTAATADTSADAAPEEGFFLTSSSFPSGGAIPKKMACAEAGGSNRSPQLSWRGVPKGTEKFAIIMDDEDTPCGPGDKACVHWGLFNIPAGTSALEEGGAAPAGTVLGVNYTGAAGYAGPCPPRPHNYRITIYALGNGIPDVPQGVSMTRSQFAARYDANIFASVTIEGTFSP